MVRERSLQRVLSQYGKNVQLQNSILKKGLNNNVFNPFFYFFFFLTSTLYFSLFIPVTASRISFNRSLAKIKSVNRLLVEVIISEETPCHSLCPS